MIEFLFFFFCQIHSYSTQLVASAFCTAFFTTGNVNQQQQRLHHHAPDCHFRRCVCANPQCFDVQTALCKYDQNHSHAGCGEGTSGNVWCQHPIQVNFDWATASFKSWLFILSLCHHLTEFKTTLVSFPTNKKQTMKVIINQIHFPKRSY